MEVQSNKFGSQYLDIKVVGVTFENSDGSKRQRILEELADDPDIDTHVVKYDYNGCPAYRVECNGRMIGSVPATVAENLDFLEQEGYFLFVNDIFIYGGPDEDDPDKYYGARIEIKAISQEEQAQIFSRSKYNEPSKNKEQQKTYGMTKEEYDNATATPRAVRKWVIIVTCILIGISMVIPSILKAINYLIFTFG